MVRTKEPFAPVHENMALPTARHPKSTIGDVEHDRYAPYNPRQMTDRYRSGAEPRPSSTTRPRAHPSSVKRMEHQRPRPISTGRMVGREDDPESVARAILDLRDKREISQSRRQNIKQLQLQRSNSLVDQQQEPFSAPLSPRSLNREEQQASFKLKEAEHRIGNLMQELEELRFFHEIDMEPSSPAPVKSVAGVPRANASPVRAARFLSPRRLTGMDRTSLELEAQELQRQVDILMQEKNTLLAKIQTYEAQTKSHTEDATRIQSVEKALKEMRELLAEQIQDIHHGRAQLTDEYEAKLDSTRDKYRQAKKDAEELVGELDATRDRCERIDEEYSHFREQTKQKLQELQRHWEEKESEFERMLADINTQHEMAQQTLEDRDQENVLLRQGLKEKEEQMNLFTQELKQEHAEQVQELETRIKESFDKYEKIESDYKEASSEIQTKTEQLTALDSLTASQTEKIDLLQRQISEMEDKYELRIDDLKRTLEAREQRRLDDLVKSQHTKSMEYEERLVDLRKQLNMATDRHHTEMEQKEIGFRERMEKAIQDTKDSVRSEYESKLSSLREELANHQAQYASALEETRRYQVRAESKDRNTAREMERIETLRQGEMERLNDKLDRSLRDLAEREAKIQSLTDRLAESDERCQLLLNDLESQHNEEVKTRDELMLQRKAVTKLKSDLARKDYEFAEMREEYDYKLQDVKKELDQAMKALGESERRDRSFEEENKHRIGTLQVSLEKAQKDLASEQARHESLETELRVEMAKVEGKLSATESTLKEKRSLIEDLEIRLAIADENSSSSSTKMQSLIATLKRDLNTGRKALEDKERSIADKDQELAELRTEIKEVKQSYDLKVADLEASLVACHQKLERVERENVEERCRLEEIRDKLYEVENQKTQYEKQATRLREEQREALMSLRSLSNDNEEVSFEHRRREKELNDRVEAYEEKVANLEKRLEEKEHEAQAFEAEAKELQAAMKRAVDTTDAKTNAAVSALERRIKELERELESLRSASSSEMQSRLDKLQDELKENEASRNELARQLSMVINERSEAIDALEQMIEEVQIRQEEFDSLADILEKREEELENAKMIATKALASAQEIKTRYKEKGDRHMDRHTDLQLKIDELTANVEYLTSKNEKMRNKMTRLESELLERNNELVRLRDDLREHQTQSTKSSSFSSTPEKSSPEKNGFVPLDGGKKGSNGKMNNFMLMESGFSVHENEPSVNSGGLMFDTSMSTNTADLGDATKWLQDFEDGTSVFSSDGQSAAVRSEPSPPKTTRATDRDALRKYVRKRYLKRNSPQKSSSM